MAHFKGFMRAPAKPALHRADVFTLVVLWVHDNCWGLRAEGQSTDQAAQTYSLAE